MPGASGWPLSLSASSGGCTSARPSTRSMSLARQAAGPQQHRLVETADDGGFDADLDRAAIDDQVDPAGEIALHMGGRGRRDVAGEIGRRRHHRAAEGAQDVARDRVRGNPDRDGVEAGGGEIGHRAVWRLGQHQRQRARPERLGQRAAPSASKRAICRAAARSPTWAISGLKAGRPLAW